MMKNFFLFTLLIILSNKIFAEDIPAQVVFYESSCHDYFLAKDKNGDYYLLEWYGGYTPSSGDIFVGNIKSYGKKEVRYTKKNREGKIYVSDYGLSKDDAIEKIKEKCF